MTFWKRSNELRKLPAARRSRAIEVISEASRAIPDELKARRPEIPWQRVRGIGNVLRHEYRGLSDPIIWKVVVDELPRLKRAVEAIDAAVEE